MFNLSRNNTILFILSLLQYCKFLSYSHLLISNFQYPISQIPFTNHFLKLFLSFLSIFLHFLNFLNFILLVINLQYHSNQSLINLANFLKQVLNPFIIVIIRICIYFNQIITQFHPCSHLILLHFQFSVFRYPMQSLL